MSVSKTGAGTKTYRTETFELKTGVVLKLHPFSGVALEALEIRFPDPVVPKVYDEHTGREIENPMHPDYLKAVDAAKSKRALAALDAIVGLGTTLEAVPEGMDGPDSQGWKDRLDLLGYDQSFIESKLKRYVEWIKLVAAGDADGWEQLTIRCLRLSGVPEVDVDNALDKFKSEKKRPADMDDSA